MSEAKKKKKSKGRVIAEWVFFGVFLAFFAVALAAHIDMKTHMNENYGQKLHFGIGKFIVETDSMEPEYKVKTAIITYKDKAENLYASYQKGETLDVTFMDIYSTQDETSKVTKDPDIHYNRTPVTKAVMTHRIWDIKVDETKTTGNGRFRFFVAGINPEGTLSHPGQYQVFTEKEFLGVVKINSPALGAVFEFISSPMGLFTLLLIPALYLIVAASIDIIKALKAPKEAPAEGPAIENKGDDPLAGFSDADKERLKKEMLAKMLSSREDKKK